MNMNGISNISCRSTQACMQNNGKNLCFQGCVGKGLQNYLTQCAKDEVFEYTVKHPNIEHEAFIEVATKIANKWITLLDELSEKMSKAHKKSVLDCKDKHSGDMGGNWVTSLVYRNSKIKDESIERDLRAYGGSFGRMNKSDDANIIGYSEIIVDKNGNKIPYGKILEEETDVIMHADETYPYDEIYENIKDFAQRTDDTSFVNVDKLVQKKDNSTSFFKKIFSRK